jgi:hypothetical protein
VRISRPVLGERRGAIPLRHSTIYMPMAGSAKPGRRSAGIWAFTMGGGHIPALPPRRPIKHILTTCL